MLKIINWEIVVSGEILDIRDGTHDTPKYIEDKLHPLITSKNLKDGRIDLSNIKYISKDDFIEINKRSQVDIDDILFAMIGTIGNPVIVKENVDFAIKNIGLFKNNSSIINANFLKYFLDSYLLDSQLKNRQLLKGTTQKFIPLGHLRNLHLPLAPLPEQRAIAAKIEQLFSELDNGIANLKTAKSKLEIYRQAILKHAFEGKLTENWRKKQSKNHINLNQKNHSKDNLPATWQWVIFNDFCKLQRGYDLPLKTIIDGNYPLDFGQS